jgi:hypothetical protein
MVCPDNRTTQRQLAPASMINVPVPERAFTGAAQPQRSIRRRFDRAVVLIAPPPEAVTVPSLIAPLSIDRAGAKDR